MTQIKLQDLKYTQYNTQNNKLKTHNLFGTRNSNKNTQFICYNKYNHKQQIKILFLVIQTAIGNF